MEYIFYELVKEGAGIYRKSRGFKNYLIVLFFICILLVFIGNILGDYEDISNNFFDKIMGFVYVFSDSGKSIVKEGLPVLKSDISSSRVVIRTPEDIVHYFLYFLTRVDASDTKTFLSSCITIMNFMDIPSSDYYQSLNLSELEYQYYENKAEEEQKNNNISKSSEQKTTSTLSSKPLVAVYNTHNSETYIPTDGTAKIEGKNAGIAEVAKVLADTLESNYGIKTVYSDTIHDYPHWEKSYVNSAETLKKLIEMYPSLKVIIDVHRDAGVPKKAITTFPDGNKGATIMLVVGTDKGLPHPNWRKNWEFAKKIGSKMDELYPGLLKEVRLQSGRYNQHLHEGAILAEIGNSNNSLEEAKIAARAFAHVIDEVLKELE